MMSEYLTTREVADLLRIKERKVYDLAASGQVPCSKSMGKLLFPRVEIEAWLAAGQSQGDGWARGDGRTRSSQRSKSAGARATALPNVFLGSHDPLLEWALRASDSGLAGYFDGSSDGLDRFAKAEGIAAGLHLYDDTTQTWNIEAITPQFGNQPVVLVEWAKRQRGLIINTSLKSKVRELTDTGKLRFAGRQEGAGARQLFDVVLRAAGLANNDFKVSTVLRTETEAALAVLEGKADVCFGLESLAIQYRLAFVPIIEERYDLLVDRRGWFEPPMQTLMRFCASNAFREHAEEFAGYDVSNVGQVHFNGRL
jgi:putative molybdopterin biosynthesis protein